MKKAQEKQYKKIGLIALGVIVLAGGIMLLGQSELFQGRMKQMVIKPYPQMDPSVYKDVKNKKPVSPVVSAFPTVVASNVPSQVGPSIVISKVPSAMITAVASSVALTAKDAAKYNVDSLPVLTADVLKKVAKQDMLNNPLKYKLTNNQKRSMINLYMQKMKR